MLQEGAQKLALHPVWMALGPDHLRQLLKRESWDARGAEFRPRPLCAGNLAELQNATATHQLHARGAMFWEETLQTTAEGFCLR